MRCITPPTFLLTFLSVMTPLARKLKQKGIYLKMCVGFKRASKLKWFEWIDLNKWINGYYGVCQTVNNCNDFLGLYTLEIMEK